MTFCFKHLILVGGSEKTGSGEFWGDQGQGCIVFRH